MSRWFRDRRQPFEIEPDDWAWFARLAAFGVLVVVPLLWLVIVMLNRAFGANDGVLVDWHRPVATLPFVAFGWWIVWWASYDARRLLDGERRRYGMPMRPLPGWLIVVVPSAVAAVAIVANMVGRGESVGESVSLALGLILGPVLVGRFFRWRVFDSPRNRAKLDAEWACMHAGTPAPPQEGTR